MIPVGHFSPFEQQRPLARLQTRLCDKSRSLRVGWFGLLCGEKPLLTLALSEGGIPRSDWQVGQPLILTIPIETAGHQVTEVCFRGHLAEVRDWYGKLLLKASLTNADGGGCHLTGRSLNRLCQIGSWKRLFLPNPRPA